MNIPFTAETVNDALLMEGVIEEFGVWIQGNKRIKNTKTNHNISFSGVVIRAPEK